VPAHAARRLAEQAPVTARHRCRLFPGDRILARASRALGEPCVRYHGRSLNQEESSTWTSFGVFASSTS
jgi:hypothetical protein